VIPPDGGQPTGPTDPGGGGGVEPITPVEPTEPTQPVEPTEPGLPAGFKALFLNRTSFGATEAEQARYDEIGYEAYLEEQLNPGSIAENDVEINALLSPLWTLTATPTELLQTNFAQAWNNVLTHLAKARLIRAVKSKRQLNERMVDFWLDHFNIQAAKTPFVRYQAIQYERDVIRPFAFGKFRDLLHAVAKSPAMALIDGKPGTGSSQFFISMGPHPTWRDQYTAFGKITGPESQAVLRRIAETPVDEYYRPTRPVRIRSISIVNAPTVR